MCNTHSNIRWHVTLRHILCALHTHFFVTQTHKHTNTQTHTKHTHTRAHTHNLLKLQLKLVYPSTQPHPLLVHCPSMTLASLCGTNLKLRPPKNTKFRWYKTAVWPRKNSRSLTPVALLADSCVHAWTALTHTHKHNYSWIITNINTVSIKHNIIKRIHFAPKQRPKKYVPDDEMHALLRQTMSTKDTQGARDVLFMSSTLTWKNQAS